MRLLIHWVLVLAAVVVVASSAVTANDSRQLVILDNVGGGNAGVAETALLALDVVPYGVVPCNKGRSEIRVLFGISLCFSDIEILGVLTTLYASVVAVGLSHQFCFNNRPIPRSFEYGAYLDGSCGTDNRFLPAVVFDNLKPQAQGTRNFDLFVNIAKNKGGSFTASLAKNNYKVDATLDVRVCLGAWCPWPPIPSELVVPLILRLCDVSDEITTAMHCADVTGARPWAYTSDQHKLQCGCTCSGGKVPINGVCSCPGELTADANGACGCSCGRVASSENKCVCPGGRVFVNNVCVCPTGLHEEAGVCVPDCYWTGGLTGSVYSWKSAKSVLRLFDDCALSAPVPKNNAALGSPSANVMVTLTATKRGAHSGLSKAATWLSCAQKPGDLENQISVGAFGVHDLSMAVAALSYNSQAAVYKCLGCVAVVDAFPPTANKSCSTSDDRPTPATFSPSELVSAIASETAFTGFYNSSNVQNNGVETMDGDNKRCDETTALVTDFFEMAAKPLVSLDTKCFTDSILTDLLTSIKRSGLSVVAKTVQNGTTASLVCERCCFKAITLKERFRKYTCSATDWEWATQGASNCQYGRCLRVRATNLLTVSSDWSDVAKATNKTVASALPPGTTFDTGPTVIHRSITCTKFDQGCKVESKLGELLKTLVVWKTLVPSEFEPEEFVYWHYKSDGVAAWKPWKDTDVLTFQDPSTLLSLQAWSRCGLVYEAAFKVKLHPHTPRDTCNNFVQRFTDNSPSARKLDGSICTVPGSDFALLTFRYDSLDNVSYTVDTVRGTYTDVKCFITLAEEGALAISKEIQLPLDWNRSEPDARIRIVKPFALELVNSPTTSKNTDGKIRCEFAFKYVDSGPFDTDTCEFPFQLTDCDPPTLGASRVCVSDQCGSPVGKPGAFEACAGDVFTAVRTGTVTSTTKKALPGLCCTACSQTLSCSALVASAGTGGVKRCEPPLSTNSGFLALAEGVVAALARVPEQQSPRMGALVGLVSVGVLAVVVGLSAKMRVLPKTQRTQEALVPLLE